MPALGLVDFGLEVSSTDRGTSQGPAHRAVALKELYKQPLLCKSRTGSFLCRSDARPDRGWVS
jgi:hypothetical protein